MIDPKQHKAIENSESEKRLDGWYVVQSYCNPKTGVTAEEVAFYFGMTGWNLVGRPPVRELPDNYRVLSKEPLNLQQLVEGC